MGCGRMDKASDFDSDHPRSTRGAPAKELWPNGEASLF